MPDITPHRSIGQEAGENHQGKRAEKKTKNVADTHTDPVAHLKKRRSAACRPGHRPQAKQRPGSPRKSLPAFCVDLYSGGAPLPGLRWWRWGELNPRPMSCCQGFSGRSLRRFSWPRPCCKQPADPGPVI